LNRRARRYDVFLSYARSDDAHGAVQGLADEMRDMFARRTGHELRIFHDKQEIRTAQIWQERVGEALAMSTVLVAVISEAFLDSPWCRREWNYFIAAEHRPSTDRDFRRIFPVLLNGEPQLARGAADSHRRWLDDITAREYVDLGGVASGTRRHRVRVSRLMDGLLTALHGANVRSPGPSDDSDVQHLDAFGGYVRDRARFMALLAEAVNVTIVGQTNENLAKLLAGALDRKQANARRNDEFWGSLRIVFLKDKLLDSIILERADSPDRDDALRRRRLAAAFGKRSVSLFLHRIPSDHWELYESPYHVPFAGTLFEMRDGRRIVQLVIPRPERSASDHLYLEFQDRADHYFAGAFGDIVHNSALISGIIPVGLPQDNGAFLCIGTRFRQRVLLQGSGESGWLPVVLAVTWRNRDGRKEPLLQLRTVNNSHREIKRLSHLSSYVIQDDIITATSGSPLPAMPRELPDGAPAEAVRRRVEADIGFDPGGLAPVQTGRYLHADMENLFFFVFTVECPGLLTLERPAEMRPLTVPALLAARENQALRNAVRLCKQARLTRVMSKAAAEIVALNLILHGHDDVAADLMAASRNAGSFDQLAQQLRALVQQTRQVQAELSASRNVQVAGLAGLQYREFFTMLLPLYQSIGIAGAAEALAELKGNEEKLRALTRLSAVYLDEEVMASVPAAI